MVLGGIKNIIRLAGRLESAFKAEVTSSGMSLVYETPHTAFDKARMTSEFGSNEASTNGEQEKVAGTMGMGVRKGVSGGRGEGARTEVLLKAKAVWRKTLRSCRAVVSGDIATALTNQHSVCRCTIHARPVG